MGSPLASRRLAHWLLLSGICTLALFHYNQFLHTRQEVPVHVAKALDRCRSLTAIPGPPSDFHSRSTSDRFELGTNPTVLLNARIWTGEKNGTEVVEADILLDKGIIRGIGHVGRLLSRFDVSERDAVVRDVNGSWVIPGIVDMHSHLGDAPSPGLDGAEDDNSMKGPIVPWMRSLDGLNTHDDAFRLSISGGVTTSLILPGSANAIGGQGFPVKLRTTSERSASSMLLEPPSTTNSSYYDHNTPLHWRHIKHACGENPSRVYSNTRMDTIWAFREAYNTAKKLKESQDAYCAKATAGHFEDLGDFPEDLAWEPLSEVLRGRVKVQVHCYETTDLDGLSRISNEFKFPITAFHHAHETYLVPNVLRNAYGSTPGVAIFANNARYKREAYRGTPFAAKILASEGIEVAMKSDHPVMNSRYLLYEAQNAYYYGLPENLAIASVTSTPAKLLGLGHRVGFVKEGWDADLVVFDSHPLALGATPKQVYIDGIPQLDSPFTVEKPKKLQEAPKVPNFDKEVGDAIKYEGLPPLLTEKNRLTGDVLFMDVKNVYTPVGSKIRHSRLFRSVVDGEVFPPSVLVQKGQITCIGRCTQEKVMARTQNVTVIDLEGGALGPGLVSFGAPLGLEEIQAEKSTNDGMVIDPLTKVTPKILDDGEGGVVRAVDGLSFMGRDTLLAYRGGVTTAISAPVSYGFLAGLGVAFSTGARHKLEDGAVVRPITALHVHVGPGQEASVSTQIATLRKLLIDGAKHGAFQRVAQGKIPLVVHTHSADIIATLIVLKGEVEHHTKVDIKLTIAGGGEAHLLAKELGEANVGVILNPVRPFPASWESRRILPGPPLTEESQILRLLNHGITVGVGVLESWEAQNARFDLGWAALEAGDKISKEQAYLLGTVNMLKLFGVEEEDFDTPEKGLSWIGEFVATAGGDLLEFGSKVVAVASSRRGFVDVF
ncbi:carbohydrate esterase family 9 protein [Thelephora ganbajun]|uniref:Carbohydrate esterase family 9 protein n=1 Tax=Thelephora ganbajun TaxID=370292 RepID=A0ACB6ZUX4_THEGA|nr:carbohydrate esterase family 9 protein [Thelephora ganbajun]